MPFTVLNFPIEPITDRYSIEWDKWFREIFEKEFPRRTVTFKGDSDLPPPSPREFLNTWGTSLWKLRQLYMAVVYLNSISARIGPDDVFVCFFHDAWYPGIETLKYIADLNKINLKIVGWWHAGSYLSNDLLGIKGLHKWAEGSEQTWFSICDAICVGSKYHKDRILASLGQKDTDADKVHVTGYPVAVPGLAERKENIVVWPHRIAEDKHPEIFDMLAKDFAGDWEFIKTKEVCKTKEDYYKLLSRAKIAISTATMETFGISMVEAAMLGCHCLVPDTLCYPETFPNPQDRYNSYEDLRMKLGITMGHQQRERGTYYPYAKRSSCGVPFVIGKVCKLIRQVGGLE